MKYQKPIFAGMAAAAGLLAIYFTVVGLISGMAFAVSQFQRFWYYTISLAIGFGIQVGLYVYLRRAIKSGEGSGKILAASGSTSTASMIACCAHYIANILPFIATAGIVTFITQYQTQFFWIGLAFNGGGILYITNKIQKFNQHL